MDLHTNKEAKCRAERIAPYVLAIDGVSAPRPLRAFPKADFFLHKIRMFSVLKKQTNA